MTRPFSVRPAGTGDVDAILELWQLGGVSKGAGVDRAEIERKIEHGDDLFLVLFDGPDLAASVMGTWDGHRGRIKRCVVDPARQGQGLGRRIVGELEARFLERGITELRLEVWADNAGGLAFWQEMGWELLHDIRYFQRSLGENRG